ncbi:hypothetical protein CALVIDRAFT_527573 [Calocera viscosa TUFC12733]|uniref:Uncharacterized protein n=1 Tax=Calocera viscosa (strain TUFC12733) TaxID=1330018 RepID=A0A167LWK5_CALVF|nr:hypothetical protein CALVIDRAFT_527573 [Calocera viscosa TUFC12733]
MTARPSLASPIAEEDSTIPEPGKPYGRSVRPSLTCEPGQHYRRRQPALSPSPTTTITEYHRRGDQSLSPSAVASSPRPKAEPRSYYRRARFSIPHSASPSGINLFTYPSSPLLWVEGGNNGQKISASEQMKRKQITFLITGRAALEASRA